MTQTTLVFDEVLEAIDGLTLEEQEEVASLLRQRLIDHHRGQLATDIHSANQEHEQGRCRQTSAAQIIGELTE